MKKLTFLFMFFPLFTGAVYASGELKCKNQIGWIKYTAEKQSEAKGLSLLKFNEDVAEIKNFPAQLLTKAENYRYTADEYKKCITDIVVQEKNGKRLKCIQLFVFKDILNSTVWFVDCFDTKE